MERLASEDVTSQEPVASTEQQQDVAAWHEPLPEIQPHPTYWPAVMAIGVVFIAWGIISYWAISVVGVVLLLISLAGWIRELRRDHS